MESQAERLRQIYYKDSFCLQRRVGTTRKGFEALRGVCENGSCALSRQAKRRIWTARAMAAAVLRAAVLGAANPGGAPPQPHVCGASNRPRHLAVGPAVQARGSLSTAPSKPADKGGRLNSLQVVDN